MDDLDLVAAVVRAAEGGEEFILGVHVGKFDLCAGTARRDHDLLGCLLRHQQSRHRHIQHLGDTHHHIHGGLDLVMLNLRDVARRDTCTLRQLLGRQPHLHPNFSDTFSQQIPHLR